MVGCEFRFGEFGLESSLDLSVAGASGSGRDCTFLRSCFSAGYGRRNRLVQARNGGEKQHRKERLVHRDRVLFLRGERYYTVFRKGYRDGISRQVGNPKSL